jgi:hypothetical protein
LRYAKKEMAVGNQLPWTQMDAKAAFQILTVSCLAPRETRQAAVICKPAAIRRCKATSWSLNA